MEFIKIILFRVAKKWIAGESLSDVIKRTKEVNQKDMHAIINFLGEHVKSKKQAENNVEEYFKILESIRGGKLNASISLKLTEIDLDVDEKICYRNLLRLVRKANQNKIFVWIDMEESKYTQITIDFYLKLLNFSKNVGISIQSNLKRSKDDVERILAKNGIIRLTKGAYKENSRTAFQDIEQINENFSKIMKMLFEKSEFFAIATHDDKLVQETLKLRLKYSKNVEFQFLKGIRDDLKVKLAQRGFDVAEYIPYGTDWLAYGLRRLQERRRNFLLLFRSLIRI